MKKIMGFEVECERQEIQSPSRRLYGEWNIVQDTDILDFPG